MTLTRILLENYGLPVWYINEILKYKQDAEKLEIACDDAAMQLMKRQEAEAIVERLKKRIEEVKKNCLAIGNETDDLQVELQKILREA